VPLRIVTILGRLKQDLADEISPNAIEQACKEENTLGGSERSIP
jgi:hypothetical protein